MKASFRLTFDHTLAFKPEITGMYRSSLSTVRPEYSRVFRKMIDDRMHLRAIFCEV